ncbi:hypothetical protein Cfor_01403 [Coptotermes formosanus]|uniref:Uncharacterized protein n=1 Tax=Coptotermes formosanus TaxID=36987 RepID=A0A6L2PZH0_COPFO|nr:hypothetical protein Cfor_01403 [Coptotermes formosanus]
MRQDCSSLDAIYQSQSKKCSCTHMYIPFQVYSLLCVISQYQEYKAGRGTANSGACLERKAPQVLYTPRTTATSCMSAPRPATYHETTHSFTAPHSALLLPEDKSRSHRPSLKRVQFPDDVPQSRQTSEAEAASAEVDNGAVVLVIAQPWAPESGKTPTLTSPGVDTTPLIDSAPQTEAAVTRKK